MRILVGIRCVSRSPETIWDTIDSIKEAGFFDLSFFVDGRFAKLTRLEQHGMVIHRKRAIGAWPNFYLPLVKMVMRDSNADYYLLAEDDVLFCRDVFDYLAQGRHAIQVGSLYTSGRVENVLREKGVGFHTLNPGWNVASGNLAILFSNELAFQFMQSEFVVRYRKSPPQDLDRKHYRVDGLHHTDSVVGRFAKVAGCGIQYHYPSLCQHIGEESFMYPGFKGKEESRFSLNFPGDQVSALEFLNR